MNLFGSKTFAALILTILLSVGVGGIFGFGMMAMDGDMHDCPFMGVAALCNMTPLAHALGMQQMLASTGAQTGTLLLLLLLAVVVICYVGFETKIQQTQDPPSRYRYRESSFNSLQIAFARGILHSKAF